MNWDSINAFISVLHFLKDIKVAMRPRACNFLLALLQTEETCWSKLSSESIKIPSKVSFVLVLNEASPIDTSVGVLPVKNYCLGVPCARIWGSVINITSNVAFFTFINKSIKSILKSKGPKIEPCGTPCSILDLSLKHLLILVRCVQLFK